MSGNTGIDGDEASDAVSRRAEIIECLMDGPTYNRDIRDRLDVSRSTVYKAIRELEELDLAQRGSKGYELTIVGRLLFEEYRRYQSRVEDVCRSGTLLSVLPTNTDIPIEVLDGADVYVSERHAPNRPVRVIEEIIRDATVSKGTGPIVLPRYVELFHDAIVAGDLEAELVFERSVHEYLASDYTDSYSEALGTENLSVWVTPDDEHPYGLLIVEEPSPRIGLIVYDRDGGLKGIIVNDTEPACDWGYETWKRSRDRGAHTTTPLE